MLGTRFKLSAMMFLEFFIWGAWYPLVFGYLPALDFTPLQQSMILIPFNIAALVALFFGTQFADRNFAAEKFLAFSQFVGGLAMLGLFWMAGPTNKAPETWLAALTDPGFLAFFGLMLVHTLFYVPTISITNSIAFANLTDAQREFGPVRLWGTIGWIAASWPFVFLLVDWAKVPAFGTVGITDWLGAALGTSLTGEAKIAGTRYIFAAAGAASLLLAAFSLILPHTPPKPATAGRESLAWMEALKLLRHPFILVLFVVTFLDAAIHQYYFFWTGRYLEHVGIPSNWVMPVMSIGQIAEIVTMFFLGYVLKNLGWRTTMIIGILGHAARFAVFAYLPYPAPAILVNLLHGICYAFFFATVYIFVDEYFPKDARSSAQGLFNALILGLGPIATNFLAPWLGTRFTDEAGAVNFQSVFLVPCLTAVVAAVMLFLFFHPPRRRMEGQEPGTAPFDQAGEKWVKDTGEGIKKPGEIVPG
jgi:nucleoside transporter